MIYVAIFLAGLITGAVTLTCYALCKANKTVREDETPEGQSDVCDNCFGAAEGDCGECTARKKVVE